MRVRPSSHSIFMQVAFDSLNHLDLLAGFVECDGVRVRRAKENLKHLERVTVEGVARDLVVAICTVESKVRLDLTQTTKKIPYLLR